MTPVNHPLLETFKRVTKGAQSTQRWMVGGRRSQNSWDIVECHSWSQDERCISCYCRVGTPLPHQSGGGPPCVVGRRCGVMHVFNNSPLAPCVLAHLPSRVNVYAYARWPVSRSPACCYCMPFPSGNQAAV